MNYAKKLLKMIMFYNGITVCHECHKKAEVFHQTEGKEWVEGFHPNDLYALIGSSYELAVEKSEQLKK